MITYMIIKILSDMPFILAIALLSALITFIVLCICFYAKGYRISKQTLTNATDKLLENQTSKLEKKEAWRAYYKKHKPHPWSVWRE